MWHVIDASMSLDDVTSKVNLDSPLPAPASTRTLLPANRYSLALSLFVSVLHMFLSVLTEWCVHQITQLADSAIEHAQGLPLQTLWGTSEPQDSSEDSENMLSGASTANNSP